MAGLALRMEPYNPDARDADGDGIVQEWTPWERPGGTRLLDAAGKEIERGATLAQRPKDLKVVDSDGKVVNYTPTYAGGALGTGIAAGAGAGKPAPKKPEGKPTPLAEHGAPSLREMGLATVRTASSPEPTPEPVVDPDQEKKKRWTLLRGIFGGEIWGDKPPKIRDPRTNFQRDMTPAEVKKSRLKIALSHWRSSFGNSYLLEEAAASEFDPEYQESHMAKALVTAVDDAPVRRWSVRVDSRQFSVGQVVDFPLISAGSSSEEVRGFEGFNDIFGVSDPRGTYIEFRNAPSLPHMLGDEVDEREFILSGQFRVVSISDYSPPWENRPGSPVGLRGRRKRVVMEYIGPSKEVKVDGRTDGVAEIEPLTEDDLKNITVSQLARRFAGETGETLKELDRLLHAEVSTEEQAMQLVADLWAVKRKLDASRWDYERGGFAVLNDLWEALGYREPARVVSEDEFVALQQSVGVTLYRGVSNAEDGKSAKEIHEQLWGGELWQGNGVFGQGTYFAGTPNSNEQTSPFDAEEHRREAVEHAAGYGFLITQAVLDPNARVLSNEDADALRARVQEALLNNAQTESRRLVMPAGGVQPLPELALQARVTADIDELLTSVRRNPLLSDQTRRDLAEAITSTHQEALKLIVFDKSVIPSLMGYDALQTTALNWNVLNRSKLVSDGLAGPKKKMLEESIAIPRPATLSKQIEEKNKQVLDAIKEAGGSLFNPSEEFVEKNKGRLGDVSLQTAEQSLESRKQAVGLLLDDLRLSLTSPVSAEQAAYLNSIDQRVKTLILQSSNEELLEIMAEQAAGFYADLRSPGALRVRVKEDKLRQLLEDGRWKTTHEAESDASPSAMRQRYELQIGIPEDAAPELRPASGYFLTPAMQQAARERYKEKHGVEPDAETLLDEDIAGSQLYNYGEFEIILRPEVAGRAAASYGDTLRNGAVPAALTETDPDKMLLSMLPGYGVGRPSDLDPIVLGLLKSSITGSFENLNSRELDDSADLNREYIEALIPGAFEVSEISEIRVPFTLLSSEGTGYLRTDPRETQLAEQIADEIFTDDLLRGRHREGWDAEKIAYVRQKIAAHRSRGGKGLPSDLAGWVLELEIRKRIAREKIDMLRNRGIKVTPLYEPKFSKNRFRLEDLEYIDKNMSPEMLIGSWLREVLQTVDREMAVDREILRRAEAGEEEPLYG